MSGAGKPLGSNTGKAGLITAVGIDDAESTGRADGGEGAAKVGADFGDCSATTRGVGAVSTPGRTENISST